MVGIAGPDGGQNIVTHFLVGKHSDFDRGLTGTGGKSQAAIGKRTIDHPGNSSGNRAFCVSGHASQTHDPAIGHHHRGPDIKDGNDRQLDTSIGRPLKILCGSDWRIGDKDANRDDERSNQRF